jgi:hypothetical protein
MGQKLSPKWGLPGDNSPLQTRTRGAPPRLPAPPPRAPPNGSWTWELAAGDPSGAAAVAKACGTFQLPPLAEGTLVPLVALGIVELTVGKGCRAALHLAGMGNGMPVENSTRKCATLWALIRARTACPTSPPGYTSTSWRSGNRLVSGSKMSQ